MTGFPLAETRETSMHRERCPNFNHRKANPPVRHCPVCGEVVNKNIPAKECTQEKHTKKRRERSLYCIDCGLQLIA